MIKSTTFYYARQHML